MSSSSSNNNNNNSNNNSNSGCDDNNMPMVCFFKCGISPAFELTRGCKARLAKAAAAATAGTPATPLSQSPPPSAPGAKPVHIHQRFVQIGSARSAKPPPTECEWDGTVLIKTPEDVDEDILSNAVLPVLFPFPSPPHTHTHTHT